MTSALSGFGIRRIEPTHDYIRRHGTGPRDGWARGPADPGPARNNTPPTDPTPVPDIPPAGMPAAPFVHLHVHSNFSFLDGGSRIEELVARAAALGQSALALTDHDGLYGIVRFAKACAKHGIKPIYGVEVQVEPLLGPGISVYGADPESHGSPIRSSVDGASTRAAATTQSETVSLPTTPYHLILLAETREGYANLCRLISAAHLTDSQRRLPPTVNLASLNRHRHGLICLTACRHGEVGAFVDAGRDDLARTVLLRLRDIFGPHHLFVEMQHFGYQPHRETGSSSDGAPLYQKIRGEDGRLRHPRHMNPADYDVGFHPDDRPWKLSCDAYCLRLLALAHECGLSTVLTANAHYARPEDRDLHLVCRAAGRDRPLSGYPEPVPGQRCLLPRFELEVCVKPLWELHNESYANNIASTDSSQPGQQRSSLPTTPAALSPLDTPALIAERCTVDLDLGTYHFPQVPITRGETAYSLLAKRCFRGLARMYRPVPPRAVQLLEKELAMIERMGFAHYFLVVHDIVRWARERGIYCSGRGSAGNSIVCYALDITASDPIRHNLLFERFLNPNRREMPDIDVDFCSERRDEVIDYIYRTFGRENVAVVANVNTMSPRSAVRTVAEALGYAPTEINALAKHVPRHGDAARIREYLAGTWPELRDSPLQDSAPPVVAPDGTMVAPGGRYARLLDLVERLDAFPLHLGTHLGGFVIADRPITYYAPLQWAAKGVVVTQFNKDDVAALGLVKMDILGLRTHSAVAECIHLIRQRTGRRLLPYRLPPEDPAAYEIVSNGGSIGLFQLESAGQRNLATRLQEQTFDDIIAAIALYRPGPLEAEMIGPFIDRRWGIEPVTLPHPAMAEALADTYGVILYQEQVLRVAQLVAGFDPAEADMLRRTMTRDRSREEMAAIGETFVTKAVANGVPAHAAREVFRQLEGFAAYGFNKSHSVCFAVIAYATAYLKAHYPAEFLCAVLNNQPMGFYTPRTVLNDARRFGLEVRPLDINLSGRGFTVEDAVPPDPWAGYAAAGILETGSPDGSDGRAGGDAGGDSGGRTGAGCEADGETSAGNETGAGNEADAGCEADEPPLEATGAAEAAEPPAAAAARDAESPAAIAVRATDPSIGLASEVRTPSEPAKPAQYANDPSTYSAQLDGVATRAPRPQPYDPFAFAWTKERRWGLTAEDLAELRCEQNGEDALTEALSREWKTTTGGAAADGVAPDRAALTGAAPGEATPDGVTAEAPLARGAPGQVESHHAGDYEHDGEDAHGGDRIAQEDDADQRRPRRPDTGPNRVSRADGERLGRQVEKRHAGNGEDDEDDGRYQAGEPVAQLEGDGPNDLEQPGKEEQHPGQSDIPEDDDTVIDSFYHTSAGADQSGAAPAPGPHPGDLILPRAPRARGGVTPGACLCPEGAPAPGAGRAVRVGFSQLKQMSERALKKIEEERRVAPFTSFEDFYLRTRVEYPVAENLIRIGAFDSVEPDRTELLWRLPLLHDRLSALASAGGGNSRQLRAFFAAPERAALKHEWTMEDRVRSELELLGLTVTCHPLALYEPTFSRLGVTPSWKLPQMGDEVPVLVAGVYERAQNPWMRSGRRTMFLTLEDAYGLFECVLFESCLPACAPVVARATYFLVRGRLQNNRRRGLAVVVQDIWDLEEVLAKEAERETVVKINPVARGWREEEVYENVSVSGRKRPPGAGTTAIPKKVG